MAERYCKSNSPYDGHGHTLYTRPLQITPTVSSIDGSHLRLGRGASGTRSTIPSQGCGHSVHDSALNACFFGRG